MKPPKRPAIAIAFRSSANGFDGEILQGPDTLHGRDALVAGLHLAVGLERNAKTEVELREAFRVWLASVMAWMRFQNAPAEFLSLPAKFNGFLEDLECGRQPAALTAVPRDARGKDTLLEPVKHAVGPWNFSEVSPQQMLGRFNGFLKSTILRANEARDLGDVDRFAFYDHLKAYTAAPPDVLRVDEKNMREYSVFNVVGLIITSNHKTDGIFLPADDRRHFVAWSDLTKDDFTTDYWNGLWAWYGRGGMGHVATYLRELDIADFDPKGATAEDGSVLRNSQRKPRARRCRNGGCTRCPELTSDRDTSARHQLG